jgi:hypothetical protein
MSYVFDNSPLSVLFKNFYRNTFRSLWDNFDALVDDGRIVSTREALREIEDGAPENLLAWANEFRPRPKGSQMAQAMARAGPAQRKRSASGPG